MDTSEARGIGRSIGIWELREEARKSWDHCVSDEIIYFPEANGRNLEVSHPFAEKYLKGKLWFEAHITAHVLNQGQMHFQVIIEVVNKMLPFGRRTRHLHSENGAISGNRTMFVHPPEFVQLPEDVLPIGVCASG
jgi:hypothetical protein